MATSHEVYVPTGFILQGSSDWVSELIDSSTCSVGQGQCDQRYVLSLLDGNRRSD